MDTFWTRHAFAVGERIYTWRDVAAAAVLRGDWSGLEDRLRRGLALVRRAEEQGETIPEEQLEAAAEEFRYERELISSDEMEAWLEGVGLSVEAWMDFVERELLRAADASPDEDLSAFAPEDDEVAQSTLAEAVCSGALSRFAETLAGHAAVGQVSASDGASPTGEASPQDVERAVLEVSRAFARTGPPDLSPPSADTVAELLRLTVAFEQVCRQLATPPAIRKAIEARRLDWVRLDVQDFAFPREAAAREALLCLREDGDSIEAVATAAHTEPRESRLYLEDVDPAARPELLAAGPGDLVGPVELEKEFHLLLVRDKTLPSEKDPEVRQRAESYLRSAAVEQEVLARVRFFQRI